MRTELEEPSLVYKQTVRAASPLPFRLHERSKLVGWSSLKSRKRSKSYRADGIETETVARKQPQGRNTLRTMCRSAVHTRGTERVLVNTENSLKGRKEVVPGVKRSTTKTGVRRRNHGDQNLRPSAHKRATCLDLANKGSEATWRCYHRMQRIYPISTPY